jgi:hypothetical protein
LHPVDATFCYNTVGTGMPPDPPIRAIRAIKKSKKIFQPLCITSFSTLQQSTKMAPKPENIRHLYSLKDNLSMLIIVESLG